MTDHPQPSDAKRLIERHANAARALEHMYTEKNVERLKAIGEVLEAALAATSAERVAWVDEKADVLVFGGWDKQPFAKSYRPVFYAAPLTREAATVPSKETVMRLFNKHGGPVPDEGWCLNESGLNDFLRDLFAAPRALATSADQSASKGVPVALSDEHIEEIRTNISMLESRAWPGDRYIAAHLNLLLTTPAPVAPTDEQSNAPMAAQGPIAREDAIRMVKEYARSLKDERNDQTAMRFWHIVNLLCNGYASQAAPVAPTDERAAIPEEVRHALTHAIGGWRGAACGTRDDEEGEQRSADYRRRAQVIEDWLATCAASTAATVTLTAAQASERDHALIEAIEIVRRCTSSPIDVESRICDRLVVEGARIIGALEAARVFGAAEGTEPVPRASDALAREAIGLLRRVRQVHTGESRQPAAVERDVEDFLALNETARPVAADTGATLRADEIDEFSQTTQDFEDSGETATEYETLMDWAQRGLLECDHFKVTTDGERALAAAIAAAAVKTGEAT